VRRLPVIVLVGVAAVAVSGLAALGFGISPAPMSSGTPSAITRASSAPPPASTHLLASPSAGPTPSASLPPVDSPLADVPIVPVAQYRTTAESVTRADVQAAFEGTGKVWNGLELVESEATSIIAGLGLAGPPGIDRLFLVPDAATVMKDLAKNRKILGVIRADSVGPGVRALGWGGHTLFGVDAVKTVTAWGLTAQLPQRSDTPVFDPAGSFTIVAGGDIMLDRGVAQELKINGKGADFPFDGGTATITGHCKDCSPLGWDTPYTQRTGNAGVVRHRPVATLDRLIEVCLEFHHRATLSLG